MSHTVLPEPARNRSSKILQADTLIKTGNARVNWITVSDTAGLAIELNDSTGNDGGDLWGIDLPAAGYVHCVFKPPLDFENGIYLDVSTTSCKVTVGYTG